MRQKHPSSRLLDSRHFSMTSHKMALIYAITHFTDFSANCHIYAESISRAGQ